MFLFALRYCFCNLALPVLFTRSLYLFVQMLSQLSCRSEGILCLQGAVMNGFSVFRRPLCSQPLESVPLLFNLKARLAKFPASSGSPAAGEAAALAAAAAAAEQQQQLEARAASAACQ